MSAHLLPHLLAVGWECILARWHRKCVHVRGCVLSTEKNIPWSYPRDALWSMLFTPCCCLTWALTFWFPSLLSHASRCYVSGCTSLPCSAVCYSLSARQHFFFLCVCDSFLFISSPWLMLDSVGLRYSTLLLLLKITVLIFSNFPSVGQASSSSWCLLAKLSCPTFDWLWTTDPCLTTRKASRAHNCLIFKSFFFLSPKLHLFCLGAGQ